MAAANQCPLRASHSHRARASQVKGDYEDYTQTYVIMRSIGAAVGQSTTREVLFRYGNWCYSGRIELGTTRLAVEDLPNASRAHNII